ncbi:hypothetical protein C8Q75DRAFT_741031 [Abortiporus biennis]|nr:hypothetical protein C8Q75DRAFT_741031 [Abortiporus biennis]
MPFYPDNEKRATRLSQLVNSIADMQTDIQDYADRIEKRNKDIRPVVNKMLKEKGIDSIDVLLEKATDQFTSDDERRYKKLIDAAKKNSKLNWEELVVGLLLGPAGGKLVDAKSVLAIGRFAVRASGVQAISEFFKTAQEGSATAIQAAAEKLIQAANESEKALSIEAVAVEVGETGKAAEVAQEISKAASAASKVAVCVKLLSAIGFVVTVVMGVIELIHGAEQKTQLIEAIHKTQPTRLCIAYFAAEAKNIIQQMELFASYVEMLADTTEAASNEAAKKLREKIIRNITTDNSLINWKTLEKGLESEDKKSASYYGDDDLDSIVVVRLAKTAEKESKIDDDD